MAKGTITHIEFPADDVDRARDFYAAVAGWELTEMEGMPGYLVFRSEEGHGGGIGKRGESVGSVVRVYITVDKLEDAIATAEQHGGSVVDAAQRDPGHGSLGRGDRFRRATRSASGRTSRADGRAASGGGGGPRRCAAPDTIRRRSPCSVADRVRSGTDGGGAPGEAPVGAGPASTGPITGRRCRSARRQPSGDPRHHGTRIEREGGAQRLPMERKDAPVVMRVGHQQDEDREPGVSLLLQRPAFERLQVRQMRLGFDTDASSSQHRRPIDPAQITGIARGVSRRNGVPGGSRPSNRVRSRVWPASRIGSPSGYALPLSRSPTAAHARDSCRTVTFASTPRSIRPSTE